MRTGRRSALRADADRNRQRHALVAALVAAGLRGLLLRDGHTARKRSGRAVERLQQLPQALPARVLGRLAAAGDEVAVGAALWAEAGAVVLAADHDGERQNRGVGGPAVD